MLQLFDETNEAESTPGGGTAKNGPLATPIDSASESGIEDPEVDDKQYSISEAENMQGLSMDREVEFSLANDAAYMDRAIWTLQELAEEDNPKRNPMDLYLGTAGEIEARDAARRMNLNAQGRKNTPPNLGDEDTVFADENAAQYSIMDESDIAAAQNIGRISVNQFSSADIKATEKLAGRYWAEMGTKSPFFRAWFGDWRVNDQSSVQIADQRGDARGTQKNEDTGWDIQVSGKVFAESKHFAARNTSAIPYLPYINDIVKKAVLLDSFGMDAGKSKSQNSLLMHSLYAVADTGSGPEVLKLYVEEMNNPGSDQTSKRAYQLQNIEKAFAVNGGVQGNAPSSLANTANAIHTVADLFAVVKLKDSSFQPNPPSKAVDGDGAPKIYYHGTNTEWTAYDLFKNKNQMWGEGIYLAETEDRARLYGDNVKALYVRALYNNRDAKRLGVKRDHVQMKNGDLLVFSPEQIKSATDNIGTFDGSNPDTRYSISEETGENQADPVERLPGNVKSNLIRYENEIVSTAGRSLGVAHGKAHGSERSGQKKHASQSGRRGYGVC